MLNKIKLFLIDYSVIVLLTVFINVFIRIGEFWYVSTVKFEEVSVTLFFSKSINYDSLFILLFSLVTLVPLLLITFLNLRLAKILVRVVFSVLIVSLFALTQYFLINNALLSSSLFEFSFIEIINIVLSELSVNRAGFVIALILLLTCSIFIFYQSRKLARLRIRNWFIVIYLILGVISLINKNHTFKSLSYFESYNQFLLGNSKPIFLIKTYYRDDELSNLEVEREIKEEIIQYQSYNRNKNYSSLELPFINDSEYENRLGGYFIEKNIKPNIVIIISESLSASFSGNNLSLNHSLTPFTDSLLNVGLSWSHFFSNAERSYGVLPSLLASLPSGTGARGFINMDKGLLKDLRFPKHNSLIKVLNNNNYNTSYFYGGAGHFDNVSAYMRQSDINNCITLDQFDTTRYGMDLYARSQQAWGYKDVDVYNQGLDVLDTIKAPYLSVFQTLSNHSPYNLSDELYYTDEYLTSKLTSLDLNKEEVKKIDLNILSSIFYADDALKLFFKRIKEREDYENTIFIITGDHAVDLNLTNHVFENYHIPFIIYSPLLTQAEKFKEVSSHIDVLPTLLSLLKSNYNLTISTENHWLGEGLSASLTFESNKQIPLNIKALDMPSMIINNKVFFAGDIYQFDEELKTIKLTDSIEIKEFMNQFESYKRINTHVCTNNLIEN